MKKTVPVPDYRILKNILGVADANIKYVEEEFKVDIAINSDSLNVEGAGRNFSKACALLEYLTEHYVVESLSLEKLKEHVAFFKKEIHCSTSEITIALGKKIVHARTATQLQYLKAIQQNDVVFAVGPAGTGKTYLSVAMAVSFLANAHVQRIILTRPAVEAGESLGFLPGGISEKLSPFLRPLYDALYEMMEFSTIEEYVEKGIIEIAPLAYMRGRTLNNSFVILDEAQNCSLKQLKMFLTRLGDGSKMVLTADATQTDLPSGRPEGLLETIQILSTIKEVACIYLDSEDVVRHELVKKIIKAYESFCTQNT